MKIFIAGDVVPRNRTVPLFENKQADLLFNDAIPFIKEADISIVNLEAPIIEGKPTPIKKSGPALHTTKSTIEVLKDIGIGVVTLANNHFRDQGQPGVEATIDSAVNIGIDYVGGGKNIKESRRILYKRVNDETVAIINVCEHESSIATTKYGGSNPIDIIDTFKDIQEAKGNSDFVILIVHGGIEHYQLPTPRMKKMYHFFIDTGADVIINHHQHCLSGYEIYKDKPIFYGLGNFNFDSHITNIAAKEWNKGYAVMADLRGGTKTSFHLIPYIQNSKDVGIHLRDEDDFYNEIKSLNDIINDDKLLEEYLSNFCVKSRYEQILSLLPISNRFIKSVVRRGHLGVMYNSKQFVRLNNKLCCESHLEVLQQLFKICSNEK